jgi:cobalt-zinc-cadmium efflux system protein
LKEAVSVLMESTPKHLEPDQIRQAIIGITGVRAVHDLHVWTITTGMEALSAHAVVETGAPTETLLGTIRAVLFEQFRIDHVTIQFEPTECEQCRKDC